jgi:hypothetical protein
MPLLSITRLRIRSIFYLPKFFWYAMKSYKQALKADGNLAAKIFTDKGFVFWTCSIWEDELHMLNYMKSDIHKKAMPYLQQWCNEARTGHMIVSGNDFPSPAQMAQMLRKFGKSSKLLKPDENHLQEIFPEPVFKM